MDTLIAECRQNFGAAPRRFSRWDRWTYLSVRKPKWYTSQDGLRLFFENRTKVFETGAVVWGHIVQANQILFNPGSADAPADVIFCTDPNAEFDPLDLSDIAHALFDLKGASHPFPKHRAIGEHLANERERVYGLPIPSELSPKFPTALSTTYIQRKHLPAGSLKRSLFPLVVDLKDTKVALPLPERYWSASLRSLWKP